MSEADNPFAAPVEPKPADAGPVAAPEGPWQLGGRVISTSTSRWPRRCVKCGTADDLQRRWLTIRWIPGWSWFLLPLGLFPWVVARVFLQRVGTVQVSVCGPHALSDRMARIAVPLAGFAAAMTLPFVAEQVGSPLPLLGSIVALGLVLFFPRGLVWAHYIDEQELELGGTGQDFRALLPEWDEDGPAPHS